MNEIQTASPEVTELRDMDRDWQAQFHSLKTLAEAQGFDVGYGEHGEVTLAPARGLRS